MTGAYGNHTRLALLGPGGCGSNQDHNKFGPSDDQILFRLIKRAPSCSAIESSLAADRSLFSDEEAVPDLTPPAQLFYYVMCDSLHDALRSRVTFRIRGLSDLEVPCFSMLTRPLTRRFPLAPVSLGPSSLCTFDTPACLSPLQDQLPSSYLPGWV